MTDLRKLADAQIKHMVDRFLGWKLPEDFQPDAGISFKREFNENTPWPSKHEPVGTNLFTAVQADAMVRHMLEGLPEDSASAAKDAEIARLREALSAACGYMRNAAIDLGTGAPKKTALATVEGGLKRAEAALGDRA